MESQQKVLHLPKQKIFRRAIGTTLYADDDQYALFRRVRKEIDGLKNIQTFAFDADIKVSISICAYLLLSVIDQVWRKILEEMNHDAEMIDFFIVTEEEGWERFDSMLQKAKIALDSPLAIYLRERQPVNFERPEEKWLEWLKGLRNYNAHHRLSDGELWCGIQSGQSHIYSLTYETRKRQKVLIEKPIIFLEDCYQRTEDFVRRLYKLSKEKTETPPSTRGGSYRTSLL